MGHKMGDVKLSRLCSGIVIAVLCLFVFYYLAVVACVVVPWLQYTVNGATHMLILTCTTALALYSYVICVISDPGMLPLDFVPDSERVSAVVPVKKKDGGARVCKKCVPNRPKPPRAHHCRVCNTCIKRMDHHCTFINNCVGHGNYKVFVLFLIYVNAAMLHAVGLLFMRALYNVMSWDLQTRHVSPSDFSMMGALVQTAAMGMGLPIATGLVCLLGWQCWLLYHNKTTIEYHEGVTARFTASRGVSPYRHPYDLGPVRNLFAVFGTGACGWWVPTPAAAGDGIDFPTAWDDAALGLG